MGSPKNTAGQDLSDTLHRWLNVNQVTAIARTRKYLELPSFNVTAGENPWAGWSQILAVFNYESPNNFSLRVGYPAPKDPNYLLTIAWVGDDGSMHRYKVWENVGEALFFACPVYSGEVIRQNFRFEVWSAGVAIDLITVIPPDTETGGDGGAVPPIDPTPPPVCTPTDYDTVTPDVLSATVSWFQTAANFPAGNYRLSYTNGAIQYNPAFGFCIQWPGGGLGYKMMYNNGANSYTTSGNAKFYTTSAACIAANSGSYIEFTHTGGKIGVYLNDSPYDDNTGNVSFQLHKVCYDVVPPTPPPSCIFSDTSWSWSLHPETHATFVPTNNTLAVSIITPSDSTDTSDATGSMALPLNDALTLKLRFEVTKYIIPSGSIEVDVTAAGTTLASFTFADITGVGSFEFDVSIPSYMGAETLSIVFNSSFSVSNTLEMVINPTCT